MSRVKLLISVIAAAGMISAPGRAQQASVPSTVGSPVAPPAHAQGAGVSMTLAESVFYGLRQNRTIRSAYIGRVAEKFDLVTAEKRFSPRLDIVGSVFATRERGGTITTADLSSTASVLTPTGAFTSFSWIRNETHGAGGATSTDIATFSVEQPLLRNFGTDVNMAPVRLARLQEEINRLSLKSTVSGTVSDIIFAYRALIQAQEQVRLAAAGLNRSKELLETNRALIQAGRVAAADIVQTEADVATQEVSVIDAGRQRDSVRLRLLQLVGMDLHTNIEAVDALDTQHVQINLERAIELARVNRMDYLAQQRAIEQAKLNLKLAKNDRLWDASAVGQVERQWNNGPGTLPNGPSGLSGTVGLRLKIPLGDPVLEQNEVRATTALRSTELRLEDLDQQIEASVRDGVADVEASWRRVEAARYAHDLARRALDVEVAKFKAGRTSNFGVLSFETNLRAAENQELSANINYLNALTTLDQQLGTTLDTWRISLND